LGTQIVEPPGEYLGPTPR